MISAAVAEHINVSHKRPAEDCNAKMRMRLGAAVPNPCLGSVEVIQTVI